MRFRKLEIVVVGLTLAFVCFIGGYFTGMKSSVAVVSANARYEEPLQNNNTGTNEHSPAAAVQSAAPPENKASGAVEPPLAETGEEQPADVVGIPRVSDGRININTASRAELTDLPGIGNVLAGRIVDYRASNGQFAHIEDIRKVSGIGEKRFEAIRDRITVGQN